MLARRQILEIGFTEAGYFSGLTSTLQHGNRVLARIPLPYHIGEDLGPGMQTKRFGVKQEPMPG
ncbi:hypothetical protein BDV12DRAFT_181356 [Aspergillus spectabilis]